MATARCKDGYYMYMYDSSNVNMATESVSYMYIT